MTIYLKGARKEYKIMQDLRKSGFDIVLRSAGSHSPIDIVAIDSVNDTILLIQCKRTLDQKMSYCDPKLKDSIESLYSYLNKRYRVIFECK